MKKNGFNRNIIYVIIGILVIYQIVLLGILISSYQEITMSVVLFGAVFFLGGIVIDCVVFYVSRRIQKKLEMDEKLKELYLYREKEMTLYKNIQSQMEQLREKRHEFANQIQTAYIMMEQGASKEKLEGYLADLEREYQL